MELPNSRSHSLTQTSSDPSASAGYSTSLEATADDQHDVANTAAAALLSAPPVLSPATQAHFTTQTPTRPTRKRKPAAPGSRAVATLTPEQLAKKRANDRDAQRAIRERTKTTIEALERRIRELENQQPYQELQRALAERDKALADCEELRQRLAAVAGIVGNRTIGQTGLNELAALTAQQAPISASSEHDQYQHPRYTQSEAQAHEDQPTRSSLPQSADVTHHQQQHLDPDLRAPPQGNDAAKAYSPG